jgi:hypothetical protein
MSVDGAHALPYIPPGTTSASCAATTGGNGASIEMDEGMLEAFRGEPDGVELVSPLSLLGDGWGQSGTTITGEDSFTSTDQGGVYKTGLLVEGERYIATLSGDTSNGYLNLHSTVTNTKYGSSLVDSFEFTAETNGLVIITTTTLTVSNVELSVQKLTPATMTAAALVTMGVGSDELVVSSTHNVGTVNDTGVSVLYYHDYLGAPRVVRAYDGITLSGVVTGTWSRGEQHLKLVQTSTDGSQFRVGNQRIDIDTEVQWSSWVTFDGSFNPLEYLRFAFNNTVPLWLNGWALYKRSLSDTEIAKVLKEFQK